MTETQRGAHRPRVFISAAHKSSGKTTLSLGLGAALTRRGHCVQSFKKGPDYIDPLWHSRATRRRCYNLDFHMMSDREIERCFTDRSAGARLSLIEGNKGLYDGLDLLGSNSNAALAKRLQAPVVLVIDARGMTRGIAPLVLGYQAFDPDIRIAGVILNQLGGSRHESKLRAVIEHYTAVPVIGAVAADPRLGIAERHLGLVPANEAPEVEAVLERLADAIARQVDLDRVLEIADSAPSDGFSERVSDAGIEPVPDAAGLRIGIVQDAAFGFYYGEDLDTLEASGASLIRLDALHSPELPELDGLIIGGGFPETHLDALENNAGLRHALRRAIESGLPTHAECGGLMYLARSIRYGAKTRQMVGVIPGDVHMHERPVGRGYVVLEPVESADAAAGTVLHGHEFHHSSLEGLPADSRFAYRVRRGHGIDGQHDGYCLHDLVASYTHRRGSGEAGWLVSFLARARRYRDGRRALSP